MKQLKVNMFGDEVLCEVSMGRYPSHNQIYIELIVAEDKVELELEKGDEYSVATVCLVGYKFEPNHTAIKDYSENEGMLKILADAGIVKQIGIAIDSNTGFLAPLVIVSEEYMKIFELYNKND